LKIGYGYDAHRLICGRRLIIGGVEIPYEKGLLGHSDADVLLHAIADSMLGAAALGDIGKMFPDSDESYRDANSLFLLKQVYERVKSAGYSIGNIDSTVIAQAPRLAPFTAEMCQNIAIACSCGLNEISVKAKTEEGMGFSGRGEGISAHAVCLLHEL